jgi:hypothetical protein
MKTNSSVSVLLCREDGYHFVLQARSQSVLDMCTWGFRDGAVPGCKNSTTRGGKQSYLHVNCKQIQLFIAYTVSHLLGILTVHLKLSNVLCDKSIVGSTVYE